MVALVGGTEYNSKYAARVSPLLMGNYAFPCHRVREATHDAWAEIAEIQGSEFASSGTLEKVMPFVLKCLEPSYCITVVDDDHALSQTASAEVQSAIVAMQKFVAATKEAFAPFAKDAFEKIISDHEDLPMDAVTEFLGALPLAFPLEKPWYVSICSSVCIYPNLLSPVSVLFSITGIVERHSV
jgi:hypothetical protein